MSMVTAFTPSGSRRVNLIDAIVDPLYAVVREATRGV